MMTTKKARRSTRRTSRTSIALRVRRFRWVRLPVEDPGPLVLPEERRITTAVVVAVVADVADKVAVAKLGQVPLGNAKQVPELEARAFSSPQFETTCSCRIL